MKVIPFRLSHKWVLNIFKKKKKWGLNVSRTKEKRWA
jgi:hypothetical protein